MNLGYPAVDVHTHLAPNLSLRSLDHCGITVTGSGPYSVDGTLIGPPSLYKPKRLLSYLDECGLDQALVSVPPPFYRQSLGSEQRPAWISAINDGIRNACHIDARLKPLVYLPMEDPELAVKVVSEHLSADDVAGWSAAAGGGSRDLADAEFEKFWQLLEADGRPLVLHPGVSPDQRLQDFYLHNLLGNPVETGVAVGQLVFGRVLEKYPQLRIVLVHCGGVVPAVASRWQQGFTTARPGIDLSMRSVSDSLQQFYTDCLTHDPSNVDLARQVFGDDRLLLGSDWPFPMGLSDPYVSVRHLGEDLQEAIARGNANTLTALAPPNSPLQKVNTK